MRIIKQKCVCANTQNCSNGNQLPINRKAYTDTHVHRATLDLKTFNKYKIKVLSSNTWPLYNTLQNRGIQRSCWVVFLSNATEEEEQQIIDVFCCARKVMSVKIITFT